MYNCVCKECAVDFQSYKASTRFCSNECETKYDVKIRKLNIENNEYISAIIDPLPITNYAVDFQMHRLKAQFESYAEDYDGFEYCPDFQRGHVWGVDRQIAFIEAIARNTISKSLLTITLNCPNFEDYSFKSPDLKGFCIIDGLQRVTAIQDFVDGKFKIFDNQFGYNDFDMSSYSFKRVNIRVQVFSFARKKDLLKYYIAINRGGVVHSDEEIERVEKMLAQCD